VSKSSRKRKEKARANQKRRGGLLTGMRGGFQKMARSVAGQSEAKKSSAASNIIWWIVIAALVAFFLYRRNQ
jgi:hypothetical protein